VHLALQNRAETECASNSFSNEVTAVESNLDPILVSAAERATLLTHANGSAIALDDRGGMRCRASAGEIAPAIGSPIDSRSGLTGACLSSGSVMWSNCTDSDPMVDRESCRRLGIGSVIAVPIMREGCVIGLIEVFSRRSHAFDASDCDGLKRIAKTVADSVAGSGWLCQPRDNQPAELIRTAELGLLPTPAGSNPAAGSVAGTVPVSASESSSPATAPQRSMLASTLLPAGYKFSLTEKIMLQKPTVLWSVGAVLLTVGLWLGSGIPRQFQSTQLGASPKITKPIKALASVDSPRPAWLEQVRQRAERGDSDAELKLGAAYADSQNGAQNYSEAVKWLTRSADHGNATAAAVLGAFDWAGRSVSGGYIDAFMWSAIAQAEGDEASSYRVTILQSRMSPAELAEANRRAAAWLKTHHQVSLKQHSHRHH
jgi:GAF domain